MNIAFTLCSNNYLAQAKVLADSFLKFNNDFEFIIGLVDKCSDEVDYSFFRPATILTVDEIGISEFNLLHNKYNIVELNTAVKPFYFSYFFDQKAAKVIYLDPDILVFAKFDEVLNLLNEHAIILTPQACTPIDDNHAPSDIDLLGTGIFNLGFIALKQNDEVTAFLGWWQKRIMKYGFAKQQENMFYDQLLINLVPVFFSNYFILKHPGYNMAAWNMHERNVTTYEEDTVIINEKYELVFFHYSGYKINDPETICIYSSRYSFDARPDVKQLFKIYFKKVKDASFEKYSVIQPCFGKSISHRLSNKKIKPLPSRLKEAFKLLIKP